MKPRCYNRPPFKPELSVPDGWSAAGRRVWNIILDPMSKDCKQHGVMGEATLHPEDWDCAGCRWKPEKEETR